MTETTQAEPDPATATPPRWYATTVWWPITGALAILGLVNFPASWFFKHFDERDWLPGACVCLGSLAAQVFVIALAFGCSQGPRKNRLTWAYGLTLCLFLLWSAGICVASQTDVPFGGVDAPGYVGVSGLLLGALLIGAWLPIAAIRDDRHVQFVRLSCLPGVPAALAAPSAHWSIADLLLITTLVASLLGLSRLALGQLGSGWGAAFFAMSLTGVIVFGGMLSLMTMVGVLIFFLHYHPQRSFWRPRYTAAILPLPLVLIGALLWFPQTELTTVNIAVPLVVLTYATAIALTFAILELGGWKLEWHARV